MTNNILISAVIICILGSMAATASDGTTSDDNVYFQLSVSERQQLVEGLKKLKLSDSLSRARQLLGEPSLEEISGGKKLDSEKFIWTFYYVYRKTHLRNVNDLVILLKSSISGEIIYIHSNLGEYIRDEHMSSQEQ